MYRIVMTVFTAFVWAGCGGGNARHFGGGEATGGSSGHSGGARGTGSGGTGGVLGGETGGSLGSSGGSAGAGGASTGGRGIGGSVVSVGTGGATVIPGPLTASSGFASNGAWSGNAYTQTTGAAAIISPVCPTPCFTGTNLCVIGMVAGDPSLASSAVLGWNINQVMGPVGSAAPIRTVTTSGTGLAVTLSSGVRGGRVELQDAATVPNRWCADLTAPSVMIPWSTFTTKCGAANSTSTPTPFAVGTPIASIQIVVPGTASTLTSFRFCLDNAHQY